MKVKDLIVQLSGCDQEAYVTDRECYGINRIITTEYMMSDDENDNATVVGIVMLHAGYASDYTGE